ncbi:helix-turn-helix domain-containing protein [Bacteroides oleiciplenus]|uniref:Excisionase family DNA binding domain-containing protein n=1 Tax=Bacteroides oleiciplenus YIT 12058 TaxID=742727 RepID=K9DUX3_9BACE|nr:helix-turn-helix domain-containing protein [Bacteroides oleiciplenus]EKU88724.1 excisionase family DNA binding domain-containing protein [Bacteroides oleiciplenus YIT 12058]
MSEIFDSKNECVSRLFQLLDKAVEGVQGLTKGCKPALNGEHYLTDKEVSAHLKVSRRTLQEWRSSGQLAYIQLGGKILYRGSDVQAMLENSRRKAWR